MAAMLLLLFVCYSLMDKKHLPSPSPSATSYEEIPYVPLEGTEGEQTTGATGSKSSHGIHQPLTWQEKSSAMKRMIPSLAPLFFCLVFRISNHSSRHHYPGIPKRAISPARSLSILHLYIPFRRGYRQVLSCCGVSDPAGISAATQDPADMGPFSNWSESFAVFSCWPVGIAFFQASPSCSSSRSQGG